MASKLIMSNIFRHQTLKAFSSRFQSTSVETALYNAPATNLSCLSNGLRIASEDNGGESCTVGLWIDAGSRFENEANNGITHFLEHMIFKGTKNRSQLQLETEIESMGAYLNAYTSREQTAYFAKCLKKDLPAVVNILGDVIQNPLFDEECIEGERNAILKEMEEVDANAEEVLYDHLHATAYQGTPLAMSVLGTPKNVSSFTKSDLQDYMNSHFSTPRIVLAAAGGVDHDTLVQLGEENFTQLPTSGEGKIYPCRYTGSSLHDRNDDLQHAHITMAVEGCGWTNPDYFTLMIARTIIGSWCRSMVGAPNVFGKLAQEIHKHHFGESWNAFNLCYTDTGLFGVHMVCGRMVTDDMIQLMQEEWMRLCTTTTNAEVDRAKDALLTNMLLQVDNTTGACEDIGRQILAYGRHIPLPEVYQRIQMVDAKKVQQVCTKYIYDKCPAVAGVGPVEGFSDYTHIRSGMYWLRF